MKIKRTFTIDEEAWIKFEIICKELAINKSLFIENYIKKTIKEHDTSRKN